MMKKTKRHPQILDIHADVMQVRRIALAGSESELDLENLVRAVLTYPPARAAAIEATPYDNQVLDDPDPLPDPLPVDKPAVAWPRALEYKQDEYDDDHSEPPDRDPLVFSSLSRFVTKLYRITPEDYWIRHSLARNLDRLEERLSRAVRVCRRRLPAQAAAIERVAKMMREQALRRMTAGTDALPEPIFLIGESGHGITTLLRSMAQELGCHFVTIEDQITSCGELLSNLEDKPPAIIEVEGFPSMATGCAVHTLLSYFAHGRTAREEYPLPGFSELTADSDDLDTALGKSFVFFHIVPPPGLVDPSEYTAEELAVLLRNRQREEQERTPYTREGPEIFWNLVRNQNSVVLNATPCRYMVARLYREFRQTLIYLRKNAGTLTLETASTAKLCAALILQQGYPTPKEVDGAARRLVFDALDLIRDDPDAESGSYRLDIEATNGNLPAVLGMPSRPTIAWFKALEKQARQQCYSGHRLTFSLDLDKEARTVSLCNVTMRAPKAVMGGAFLVSRPRERFKDVVGLEDGKERLQTLVRYFIDRSSFQCLEAEPSKRILLAGPPGTGKTLLAKAFAGESGLPFFSVSSAEITSQKWAGWGGCRLRELFAAARVYRPSIIFLDELDAFGQREDMGSGEVGMDAKSILNTLLVELDGVQSADDIVVIGATNRADDLDSALTRPKRFGTRIDCDPLKADQRAQLIRLNLSSQVCEGDYHSLVDYITMRTAGPMSPAEIEEIVNESKLQAEETGLRRLDRQTVARTIDRIVLGKKFREMSEEYRYSVAYHEAGHAVAVRALLPHHRIDRLTIGLRRDSAGLTVHSQDDKTVRGLTRDEVVSMIIVALAGLVAEHEFLDRWDSGAGDDLQRATDLATHAVSDLGIGLGIKGAVLRYMTLKGDPWPIAFQDQVARVVEACFGITTTLIKSLRLQVGNLASELVQKEDLGAEEVDGVVGPIKINATTMLQPILKVPASSASFA